MCSNSNRVQESAANPYSLKQRTLPLPFYHPIIIMQWNNYFARLQQQNLRERHLTG
jgi:hypothetical protein